MRSDVRKDGSPCEPCRFREEKQIGIIRETVRSRGLADQFHLRQEKAVPFAARVCTRQGDDRLVNLVVNCLGALILVTAIGCVLAQREMEKRRSPLVSIPPFGRGFSRHEGLSSDDFLQSTCNAGEGPPALLSIGSMSPPGYPSAWLHPCSARFRFARQDHCSSGMTCRFSTSGWSMIPPEPRPRPAYIKSHQFLR